MNTNSRLSSTAPRNRKPASIAKTRWTAYAMAGVATAFLGSNCAEGEIHYSGLPSMRFPPRKDGSRVLHLGPGSVLFSHDYRDAFGTGEAQIFINNSPCQLSVAGHSVGSSDGYVSKLTFGQNISSHLFGLNCGADQGFLAVSNDIGYWTDPGMGFIGFRVKKSTGFQYGWVRVRMTGGPQNGFALLDYAYADPGEAITAGQRSSNEHVTPAEGSLGWFALGAVGLLAWRKSRSRMAR
jgi:hypothetical protein